MKNNNFALLTVTLLLVGCSPICQDSTNTVPSAPVFTSYEPLLSPPSRTSQITEAIYKVTSVVDGDTLVITDGTDEYRVRMTGIDCPELRPLEPYALEAKAYVESKIAKAGGHVRIKFDGDQTDRYGRILAMVYLPMPGGNDVWLNELLVYDGLAVSVLGFRYSDGAKKMLVQAEIEARKAKRNMWSSKAEIFP